MATATREDRGLGARARTLRMREIERLVRQRREEDGELLEARPRTRGQCIDGPRPCPWAGCRHHLALEVTKAGLIRLTMPDVEVEDMEHSCSLDIADQGEHTLDSLSTLLNLTRERVRQLELNAVKQAKIAANSQGLTNENH